MNLTRIQLVQREMSVKMFGPDVGCRAIDCVFGRYGGMYTGMNTQGPCDCPKDPQTAVKLAAMVRELLDRQQKRLDRDFGP